MNLRQQLGKKGIFTRLPMGLSGHNREEAILWRAVIDQSLKDALYSGDDVIDVQAREDAVEWVNAKPDVQKKIWDEDSTGQLKEILVCLHDEFDEVCHRAGLSPDFVRTTWDRLFKRMKK